jgi:hypothetical protein
MLYDEAYGSGMVRSTRDLYIHIRQNKTYILALAFHSLQRLPLAAEDRHAHVVRPLAVLEVRLAVPALLDEAAVTEVRACAERRVEGTFFFLKSVSVRVLSPRT